MAYDFDGSNDAISLGNGSNLNPTSFSISAWMVPDDVSQGWILARDDNSLGRSFAFGIITSAVRLQINGANIISGGLTTLSTGVLYHVGLSATSGSWISYLNGVLEGSDTTSATPASTTGATTIGQRTYSGFEAFFNGRLSEVGFWNTVLTAEEFAALGKGYSPALIRPASLISYVPLVRSLVDLKGPVPTLVDAPTAGFAHPRIIYPKRKTG